MWQNQRQRTEKQIHEEFEELRQFLLKEEAAQIALLVEEEEAKKQIIKKKTDTITRDILTFSHAVVAIENEIANENSVFLQVSVLCLIDFVQPSTLKYNRSSGFQQNYKIVKKR